MRGNTINVVFTNEEKGSYAATVVSATGQIVYAGTINHAGGSANYPIKANLPGGIYQLMVSAGDRVEKVSVVVQ